MTAQQAVQRAASERAVCWCCGQTFDEDDLSRLGAHPEVGVCAGCARWLHRRARSSSDAGLRGPGAVGRRAIAAARARVMRAGAQDWPLIGSVLRRLDRHLP